MIRLDDVAIFVQTADAGSFSLAARQMHISPGLASSAVQRLEKALGCRLFVRSTRTMHLTDDGARYLPHARAMLAAQASGQHAVRRDGARVAGPLRLSAPSDFGRNLLAPWLDAFQALHPEVSIQLRLSDRAVDLFAQPLDAAIRYGTPSDSGLVLMPLAPQNRRALCASPSYIARHGPLANITDLAYHNCLRFIWGDQVHERWRFHPSARTLTPPRTGNAVQDARTPSSEVFKTVSTGMPDEAGMSSSDTRSSSQDCVVEVRGDRICDDADVARRWAIDGRGIVYKSRIDVMDDLRAGRLVELVPGDWCEPAPLNLLSAERSTLSPSVQQLRDFLRSRCLEHLSRA
ncbi:LysR family transcriptional regulator [Robbsia andropogonis]|uniref:LysR family transcriptional regulator n=1 Tax=Robbsia andropogonis TaxID=28092 RepID=A0A0F5K2T5_9BURK|nr:LysR family transcriptional regulator [Robbsia andropogonis]KKB64174.1 LysR family transcriptional regulator [Robbsia andropogonis]